MTQPAPPVNPVTPRRRGWTRDRALLALVGLATFAAALTGNPVLAVLPVALAAGLYALTRVPVRWPATLLVLLMLVPDDAFESFPGRWQTPLAPLGDVIHFRLDAVLGLPGLAVTGMEILVITLFAVWLWRRSGGSTLDTDGRAEVAPVIRTFLWIYLAGVLYAALFGLVRGLPLAPWKLRNLLHMPLLAALFLVSFRDPRDDLRLWRLVVVAACLRALMAIVVQRFAIADSGGHWAFATSHGDSTLFAVGLFLALFDLLLRPDRSRLLRAAVVVPLIVVGAIENERRIFWVMLIMTLAAAYLLSPMRHWKVVASRAMLLVAPVAALYLSAGWNAASPVFAPVQTIRSLVDTRTNRSSYWREVENWNIAVSMRELPITGLGLGGAYTEHMANDSVAEAYKEYREWPHNSFLGLLLLLGVGGFTAVFALPALAVYLSIRSYRASALPEHRLGALACLAAVISCLVLAWGDLGMRFPQYKVIMALALAAVARLAVATGAWPSRARPSAAP